MNLYQNIVDENIDYFQNTLSVYLGLQQVYNFPRGDLGKQNGSK